MPKKPVLGELPELDDLAELEDEPEEAEEQDDEQTEAPPKKEEKKTPPPAPKKLELVPAPEYTPEAAKNKEKRDRSKGIGTILGIAFILVALGGIAYYYRNRKKPGATKESEKPLDSE